jgi:hypothetical protein
MRGRQPFNCKNEGINRAAQDGGVAGEVVSEKWLGLGMGTVLLHFSKTLHDASSCPRTPQFRTATH